MLAETFSHILFDLAMLLGIQSIIALDL